MCQFYHGIHPLPSKISGPQFVAKGHHHKRWMICQPEDGLFQFLLVISIAVLRLKRILRIPVRKFRLHQHSHLVRCDKCCFRWNVRMKAHTVYTIRLIQMQNLIPFFDCHRRMTGLRELTAVGLTTKEDSSAVQCQMAFSVISEVTDTECYRFAVTVPELCGQFIQIAFPFVPFFHICFQFQISQPDRVYSGRHIYFLFRCFLQCRRLDSKNTFDWNTSIYDNLDMNSVFFRIDSYCRQEHFPFCSQPYIPQQSVPVSLRLIGCRGRKHDRVMGQS